VGRSAYAKSPSQRAFYYSDATGILQLDSRITGLPSSILGKIEPLAINNAGVICGNATYADGSKDAFLLIPNP
jgi:hypothetical protein